MNNTKESKRATTRIQVAIAINERGWHGVHLYRDRKGNYYFSGGVADKFHTQGVCVCRLTDWTVEEWIAEFERKAAEVAV